MRMRRELERKIEKERQKIADLKLQVEKAEAFIQGLQEAVKLLPRDDTSPQLLRPGSDMAKARDLIRRVVKPLHISEIVEGIGKENTKKTRLSLGGSVAGYARRGKVFKKTAPNTFGLLESSSYDDEPPSGFGTEDDSV